MPVGIMYVSGGVLSRKVYGTVCNSEITRNIFCSAFLYSWTEYSYLAEDLAVSPSIMSE